MTANQSFDVIIVGGSYAGLSAALALGRSLRKTLIIDSGKPCNATTPHSHNFLTQDGKTPKEIAAIARQQLVNYSSVQFYDGLAIKGSKTKDGFEIGTQSGDVFISKKLIFATGIKDQLPDIPGFSECWGKSVIHCPYCHGYEYKNKRTGILVNSDIVIHLIPLVHNLTNNLTIFTNSVFKLSDEQVKKLGPHNIQIMESEIIRVEHEKGHLRQVVLKNGTTVALDALYARVPFVQHSDIPSSLGCEITESGHIKIDNMQKTTVPGVFACGDNASLMRSVANAVSSGNFTGAFVNKELAEEQF